MEMFILYDSNKKPFILVTLCYRIVARLLEWFVRRFFKVGIQVERAQFLALGRIKITTAGTRIVSVDRT